MLSKFNGRVYMTQHFHISFAMCFFFFFFLTFRKHTENVNFINHSVQCEDAFDIQV